MKLKIIIMSLIGACKAPGESTRRFDPCAKRVLVCPPYSDDNEVLSDDNEVLISIDALASRRVAAFHCQQKWRGGHDGRYKWCDDCYQSVYDELNGYCQNEFFGCYDFCYLSRCILPPIMNIVDGGDVWVDLDAWRTFYSRNHLRGKLQDLEEQCRAEERAVKQYHVDLEASVKAFFIEFVKSQIVIAICELEKFSKKLSKKVSGDSNDYYGDYYPKYYPSYCSWEKIEKKSGEMIEYFSLHKIDLGCELKSIGINDLVLLGKFLSPSYSVARSVARSLDKKGSPIEKFYSKFHDEKYLEHKLVKGFEDFKDFWRKKSNEVKDFYDQFKGRDVMVVDAVCRASGDFLDFSKKNSFDVRLVKIAENLKQNDSQLQEEKDTERRFSLLFQRLIGYLPNDTNARLKSAQKILYDVDYKAKSHAKKLRDVFKEVDEVITRSGSNCKEHVMEEIMHKSLCKDNVLLAFAYAEHKLGQNFSDALATNLIGACQAPEASQEAAVVDLKESENRQDAGFVNGVKKYFSNEYVDAIQMWALLLCSLLCSLLCIIAFLRYWQKLVI